MTGAELDALIEGMCAEYALAGFHFRDSRTVTAAGWPDWVIIGPNGILFAEAKGTRDRVTGRQRAVGYALQALGLHWQDWSADTYGPEFLTALIRSQLERIAAPHVVSAARILREAETMLHPQPEGNDHD